jgi:anti-sigma B factor antagonist/stage II sporulation protein AA (anti-sigma F factor antagonist)
MSEWATWEEFDCQIVEGEALTLRLIGDLDGTASSDFQSHLQSCRAAEQWEVFIDCTSLRFIGSEGLGVLATLHKQVCGKGGIVKLFALQPYVAEVLGVMRFDSLFAIFPDAVAARKTPWPRS